MKLVSGLLTLVVLVNLNVANAQLKQGDKAPEIIFENSFPSNYKLPKGKPILLDFWATWCAPCIAALHESNTFLDKYKYKIEFLAITDSSSKNVEQFIKKNKLKHQFLINKEQATFRDYKIKGVPTAFLIDANGVIQWLGNGMVVSAKLLDEFLTTGKVSADTESKSLSFSSIKKGEGDFTFALEEIKTVDENAFPGVMMGAKGDSISYSIQNVPLRGVIELLYKNQAKQIIFNLTDPQLLKRYYSLNVFAKHIDIKTIDFTLLKLIGTKQNFNVSIKIIDTIATVFKIANASKFNSLKTTLDLSTGNVDDFNFHIGEDKNGKPTLSGINLKLIEVQATVSEYYDTLIIFPKIDSVGYDFENISLGNFETLKKQMLEKYGLIAVKEKTTVPFLLIEKL